MAVNIKQRRHTEAGFGSAVLAQGEPAVTTDTKLLVFGDGSTAFTTFDDLGHHLVHQPTVGEFLVGKDQATNAPAVQFRAASGQTAGALEVRKSDGTSVFKAGADAIPLFLDGTGQGVDSTLLSITDNASQTASLVGIKNHDSSKTALQVNHLGTTTCQSFGTGPSLDLKADASVVDLEIAPNVYIYQSADVLRIQSNTGTNLVVLGQKKELNDDYADGNDINVPVRIKSTGGALAFKQGLTTGGATNNNRGMNVSADSADLHEAVIFPSPGGGVFVPHLKVTQGGSAQINNMYLERPLTIMRTDTFDNVFGADYKDQQRATTGTSAMTVHEVDLMRRPVRFGIGGFNSAFTNPNFALKQWDLPVVGQQKILALTQTGNIQRIADKPGAFCHGLNLLNLFSNSAIVAHEALDLETAYTNNTFQPNLGVPVVNPQFPSAAAPQVTVSPRVYASKIDGTNSQFPTGAHGHIGDGPNDTTRYHSVKVAAGMAGYTVRFLMATFPTQGSSTNPNTIVRDDYEFRIYYSTNKQLTNAVDTGVAFDTNTLAPTVGTGSFVKGEGVSGLDSYRNFYSIEYLQSSRHTVPHYYFVTVKKTVAASPGFGGNSRAQGPWALEVFKGVGFTPEMIFEEGHWL